MSSNNIPDEVAEMAAHTGTYLAILAMLVTLGCESLIWLRTGNWPAWSIGDIVPSFYNSNWVGLSKLINDVRDWPMYLGVGTAVWFGSFVVICSVHPAVLQRGRKS